MAIPSSPQCNFLKFIVILYFLPFFLAIIVIQLNLELYLSQYNLGFGKLDRMKNVYLVLHSVS